MRLKFGIKKDQNMRIRIVFFELKLRCLKVQKVSGYLNYLRIINNTSKLKLLSNSLYRIKNKCFLTSRSRGIVGKNLHLSRIKIKEILKMGMLVGFKKTSW